MTCAQPSRPNQVCIETVGNVWQECGDLEEETTGASSYELGRERRDTVIVSTCSGEQAIEQHYVDIA